MSKLPAKRQKDTKKQRQISSSEKVTPDVVAVVDNHFAEQNRTIHINAKPVFPSIAPKIFFALVFLLSVLFAKLPVTQVTDGQFSLLLARAMIYDHSTRLDTYLNPEQYKAQKGFFYWFWQISPERDGKVITNHNGDWNGTDALYYRYPTLPALLSIPGVVVAEEALGLSILDERGFYDHKVEHQVHRLIAAVVAAFTVALIFRLALLALPLNWALVVALVSGLGTQIISTLSRGVWSDTWALPISLLAIHHLFSHELHKTALRPLYLAVLIAMAFFCKPNYAVVGIFAVAYMLTKASRQQWTMLLLGGSILMMGFVSFSWMQFGTIIPDYYRPALEWKYIPLALPGHLFSPSRGLFVYCPFLLMVLYTLFRYRHDLCAKSMARLTWIPIGILMLVSSAWNTWWGGHSYGPRLIIPLLPWSILLTIIAVEAYGRHAGYHRLEPMRYATWRTHPDMYPQAFTWQALRNAPMTLILWIVSASLAVAINVQGAREPKTWLEWFYRPYPVFQDPEKRVWDWADAQWLAGIIPRPHERK